MGILERLGINSEVICAFFGLLVGWCLGVLPFIIGRYTCSRKNKTAIREAQRILSGKYGVNKPQ